MKPDQATWAILLVIVLGTALAWTSPGLAAEMTAAKASEIARRQTGGRVLAVKPTNGGFQVKVLTPSGEVRYVFVPNR